MIEMWALAISLCSIVVVAAVLTSRWWWIGERPQLRGQDILDRTPISPEPAGQGPVIVEDVPDSWPTYRAFVTATDMPPGEVSIAFTVDGNPKDDDQRAEMIKLCRELDDEISRLLRTYGFPRTDSADRRSWPG